MINAFWTALYGRLSGGTALTTLLGGTAIYHAQAPEGKALPYVVFSWQGGGYGHSSRHVDADGVVYIRAYSRVSEAQAGAISEAVFNLIDRQPLTVTGWNNAQLMAESPHIQFAETDESGLTTYSCGEEYRVLIDKN
jgi:hypothetical protein